MLERDIADYVCKQMLRKETGAVQNTGKCLSIIGEALRDMPLEQKSRLTELVKGAKKLDNVILNLQESFDRTQTITQCKLVDADILRRDMILLKIRKEELDDALVELMVDMMEE